eukprot:gene12759-12856_t
MISRTAIIPLVVASALFLENMDGTVLSTSLPAIAIDLNQDPVTLKLVFTSYLLSLAVFIPLSGWCADKFGSRTIFRAAIGIFTVASIACGFTTSLGGFVVARVLQGLGGAMMVPVGRLVVLRSVPKRELVSAMAWLTTPALIGPVIGPLIGGFITTYFHWRWIFWLNVPIGVLGMGLATFFIPELKDENPQKLDLVGLLLTGLGMAALVFGVTIIGRDLIPPFMVFGLIVGGLLMLWAYVAYARSAVAPVIDLTLLKIPTFQAALIGGTLFRIGIGAIPFLLPLMLQIGFGLSAFQSGSLTFVAAVGALVMKIAATYVLRRYGFRRVLIVNAIVSALFLGATGLIRPQTPYVIIYALLLIGGFFRSLQFTSLNTIAYADIPRDRMSHATSFSSVAQQLSSSFGVAAAAIVLELLQSTRGDTVLNISDFTTAFGVIALITGSSVIFNLGLKPDAGQEISGHSLAKA